MTELIVLSMTAYLSFLVLTNWQEFTIESDDGTNRQARTLYEPFLEVKDGRVQIPPGPGWGVRIKPEWLESATYQKSD